MKKKNKNAMKWIKMPKTKLKTHIIM